MPLNLKLADAEVVGTRKRAKNRRNKAIAARVSTADIVAEQQRRERARVARSKELLQKKRAAVEKTQIPGEATNRESERSGGGMSSRRLARDNSKLSAERAQLEAATAAEAELRTKVAVITEEVAMLNAAAAEAAASARKEAWLQEEADMAAAALVEAIHELQRLRHELAAADLHQVTCEMTLLVRERNILQSVLARWERTRTAELGRAPTIEERAHVPKYAALAERSRALMLRIKGLERRRRAALAREIAWPGLVWQRSSEPSAGAHTSMRSN